MQAVAVVDQATAAQHTLVLGRYRLLDQIAMGGTARVYRAHDQQLDREVAVKLLHPHLLPDETSRRRLAAEARAAAGLSQHPGIATVYDVDPDPQAPAIVMELVDGEPLSTGLAKGPMEPRAVARLGAEVADALYHAHRRGIVHRDVKPGNILLERDTGRARLVDFGISHSLAAGAESLTQTGTALGTPRYMAPEQMAGGRIGPRTDLWSLGAVLYQALTGRVPFDGPAPLAIAEQQRAGALPPVDGLDPALGAIVMACLSYDIADRPLDAAALAVALRGWAEGAGLEATTQALAVAPIATEVAMPSAPEVEPAAAPAPARPIRRRPVLVGGAALLVLVLVGAAVVSGLDPSVAQAPEATATPRPTPNWPAALLADYREACGEGLDRDELDGLTRREAEADVGERIDDCLAEAERADDEPGRGRGKGRHKDKEEGNGREHGD